MHPLKYNIVQADIKFSSHLCCFWNVVVRKMRFKGTRTREKRRGRREVVRRGEKWKKEGEEWSKKRWREEKRREEERRGEKRRDEERREVSIQKRTLTHNKYKRRKLNHFRQSPLLNSMMKFLKKKTFNVIYISVEYVRKFSLQSYPFPHFLAYSGIYTYGTIHIIIK